MPLSVICSPNHIRNIVPVTSVTQAVNRKLNPGVTTTPWFWSAIEAPND